MKNIRHNISIPNPCPENWEAMHPNKTGRHCNACNKTVVDFTKMTTDEVKNYFTKKGTAKTCGHFYKSQVNREEKKIEKHLLNLYYKASINIKIKAVRILVLFFLGTFLSLTGCGTTTQGVVIEKHKQAATDSFARPLTDTLKPTHKTNPEGMK